MEIERREVRGGGGMEIVGREDGGSVSVCVRARVCMLWKMSYVKHYDVRLCTDVMCPV